MGEVAAAEQIAAAAIPMFELAAPAAAQTGEGEQRLDVASALIARLARHYAGRTRSDNTEAVGGVFITEAGLNAGGRQRRVDAVHVGFTASSGHLLRGHEVKVSRADWLHELAQPDKADVWASQCHEWWLVTPHPTLVQPGELPHGWGHLVPDPRSKIRFKVQVPAARKPDDFAPSWVIVRSLFARLDTMHRATMATLVRDAKTTARADVDAELGRLRDQLSGHWSEQTDAQHWRDLIAGLRDEDPISTLTAADIRNALKAMPGLRALNPTRSGHITGLAAQLHGLAGDLLDLQQALHDREGIQT